MITFYFSNDRFSGNILFSEKVLIKDKIEKSCLSLLTYEIGLVIYFIYIQIVMNCSLLIGLNQPVHHSCVWRKDDLQLSVFSGSTTNSSMMF